MRKQIRLFLIALGFLTILPVKPNGEVDESEITSSAVYFPLVGFFLGIILVVLEYLTACFLPMSVVILILLTAMVIITGGLHLDGFADTIDALASGKSGKAGLELMHRGNTGPAGAGAITLSLAMKYFTISEFFGIGLYRALILFPMLGRMAVVLGCWLFPYARSSGTAKPFVKKIALKDFMVSFIITFIASIILSGIRGLAIMGFIMLLVIISGKYLVKRFGGITGDNLGFINELSELIALLGLCVVV